MSKLLLFLIFVLQVSCASKPSICEYLKLDNCNNSKRALSKSAGASLPSANSAAFNNPAAIALNRGLGIESIHFNGLAQLGLVTGTGRIGAAISNFPNDGTFFGNTALESTNEYRKRAINFRPYEGDKIVLAGAFNLFGAKKKKGLQADIGVIYRRQTQLEKDFYGGGIILSYSKFISLGYSKYSDIYYEDLRGKTDINIDADANETTVIYPDDPSFLTESEFEVHSYMAGLKFSNLALDYLKIVTSSKIDDFDASKVKIYNMSYFYKKWIFSYGRRFETSFREEYIDKNFEFNEDKSDSFLGAQYATKNGFVLGAFINYYLYNELSLGLTYFF